MKWKWGLLFLIIGTLFLSACGNDSAERLWLKAPDWSRAQAVGGMGIPDPAPFVVDEAGNIYFLFIDGELDTFFARIVALNAQAEPLWEHTFSDVLKRPDDPQMVWDGQTLHAFWINNGALVTTRLEVNGNVLQEPDVISGDIRVDSYSAAGTADGRLAVWFAADRRESGLYLADVDTPQEPRLIDEEGVFPYLRFGKDGTLHALWAHYPRDNPNTSFLYAAYSNGSYIEGNESVVYETNIPLSADMVGPTLGIDSNHLYIYWIEVFRTGLEAGFTQTRYISFPRLAPEQISSPQEIFIPAEHDLDYEPFPLESLQAGERYALGARPSPGISILQDINTNPVQMDELAVTFRASVNYYWRRSASQIGMVYLQDGMPTSYQLLSFTQQASTDPTVMSDESGNLYVSWLENGEISRFDVFFASTSESLQDAFNPITAHDITDLTAATIFGLLTGILLSPVAAVLWMILPMLVIALTAVLRRGEQTFRSPGTVITIILATAVFQVAKIASLPAITDYVPFSAWLPVPEILNVPLQIVVPILIMIGAIWTAWHFTYRRNTQSLLYYMILYVATDAFLTMAVYGVLFYGAF